MLGEILRAKLKGVHVVAFGPEGSGKSVQTRRLAIELDKVFISTGDACRAHKKDRSEIGRALRIMFKENTYLPSPLLARLMAPYFIEETKRGAAIDGMFRKVEETLEYPNFLARIKRTMPTVVIHLRAPSWQGFGRIVDNREKRNRPEEDTDEKIVRRLSNYHTDLATRVNILKRLPDVHLIHVNATGDEEATYWAICEGLYNLASTKLK